MKGGIQSQLQQLAHAINIRIQKSMTVFRMLTQLENPQVLNKKNEDYWQWEGEETLIRIHKRQDGRTFVPQDCEDCPCDPRIICDERETEQKFKTNTRVIKDTWRFKSDNNEATNKLNEFWTGKSTFKVLANAEVIDGDRNYKVNQGVITLCTHCSELNTIPITDVLSLINITLK